MQEKWAQLGSHGGCACVLERCERFLFPVLRPAILGSSFEERYLELITSRSLCVKSKNLSHAKALLNKGAFVCSSVYVRLIDLQTTNGIVIAYYAKTLSHI